MESYNKPLPKPSSLTAPFWQAANEGRLELQYCSHCNNFQYYPRKVCANCWSEDLEWRRCSGRGSIYSYSICRVPTFAGFEAEVPYVIAMVDLEEGVRMTSNIIDCPVTDVHIDMKVEAVFHQVTENCSLIKFRPSSCR